MSASINIFKVKEFSKETLNTIFKEGYSKEVGEIEGLNVKLNQFTHDYKEVEKNLTFFSFKHEIANVIEIGGKNVPSPYIHKADIWVSFNEKNKTEYLFASGEYQSITYILGQIKTIIQKELIENNTMIDIIMDPINMKDYFEDIRSESVSTRNTWFENVSERDDSAFLSGELIDESGEESENYTILNEKAKGKSSISILSKKLGYNITISKFRISSKNKKANCETLVDYFRNTIVPLIN